MRAKKLPDVEILKEYFEYIKETGQVFLKKTTARRAQKGTLVGSKSASGYLKVMLKGQSYYLHRIIWKLETGVDPLEIDHKDRVRDNNVWDNLREVTSSVNQRNKIHRGYSILPNGRYRVKFLKKDIGYFNCPTAATIAYLRAKNESNGI